MSLQSHWKQARLTLRKTGRGKYRDPNGTMRQVDGGTTHVRWVFGLSRAAQRRLQHIEHTHWTLPGTQEVRRPMRFDTHYYLIRYGVPISVTCSPEGRHNLLIQRFSRTRQRDPAMLSPHVVAPSNQHGKRVPSLNVDADYVAFSSSVKDLWARLLAYDRRRHILAKGGLAYVRHCNEWDLS